MIWWLFIFLVLLWVYMNNIVVLAAALIIPLHEFFLKQQAQAMMPTKPMPREHAAVLVNEDAHIRIQDEIIQGPAPPHPLESFDVWRRPFPVNLVTQLGLTAAPVVHPETGKQVYSAEGKPLIAPAIEAKEQAIPQILAEKPESSKDPLVRSKLFIDFPLYNISGIIKYGGELARAVAEQPEVFEVKGMMETQLGQQIKTMRAVQQRYFEEVAAFNKMPRGPEKQKEYERLKGLDTALKRTGWLK